MEKDIIGFIREFKRKNGVLPYGTQIAKALGYKCRQYFFKDLKPLRDEGKVIEDRHGARSIQYDVK